MLGLCDVSAPLISGVGFQLPARYVQRIRSQTLEVRVIKGAFEALKRGQNLGFKIPLTNKGHDCDLHYCLLTRPSTSTSSRGHVLLLELVM